MKNKVVLTIITILAWVLTIIPILFVVKECMNSYINGTTHGFHGTDLFYGLPAFLDTLGEITLLIFPLLFLLWCIVFIIAIILTIFSIISIKKYK